MVFDQGVNLFNSHLCFAQPLVCLDLILIQGHCNLGFLLLASRELTLRLVFISALRIGNFRHCCCPRFSFDNVLELAFHVVYINALKGRLLDWQGRQAVLRRAHVLHKLLWILIRLHRRELIITRITRQLDMLQLAGFRLRGAHDYRPVKRLDLLHLRGVGLAVPLLDLVLQVIVLHFLFFALSSAHFCVKITPKPALAFNYYYKSRAS